jgi:hypothetical protein
MGLDNLEMVVRLMIAFLRVCNTIIDRDLGTIGELSSSSKIC